MRASDLAEQIPTVRRETTGAEAVRVVAEYRLPGVVVADENDVPIAVIPGTQLLALVLPQYVRDDPNLAHAYDEAGADDMCKLLNLKTIGELLDAELLTGTKPPSVLPEDTLVEIASAMVESYHPLILVTDRQGGYHGTVLMSRVLAGLATEAGQDSHLVRQRLGLDLVDHDEEQQRASLDDERGEGPA